MVLACSDQEPVILEPITLSPRNIPSKDPEPLPVPLRPGNGVFFSRHVLEIMGKLTRRVRRTAADSGKCLVFSEAGRYTTRLFTILVFFFPKSFSSVNYMLKQNTIGETLQKDSNISEASVPSTGDF